MFTRWIILDQPWEDHPMASHGDAMGRPLADIGGPGVHLHKVVPWQQRTACLARTGGPGPGPVNFCPSSSSNFYHIMFIHSPSIFIYSISSIYSIYSYIILYIWFIIQDWTLETVKNMQKRASHFTQTANFVQLFPVPKTISNLYMTLRGEEVQRSAGALITLWQGWQGWQASSKSTISWIAVTGSNRTLYILMQCCKIQVVLYIYISKSVCVYLSA